MKTEIKSCLLLTLISSFLLLPSLALADPGNQYCITPPFITAGVKPNLLLMIDNSASMYDLNYTDKTTHKYCANSTGTSCATVGAECAGAAICKMSAVTTATTTKSPLACTVDADCRPPVVGGVINDQCKSGQCNKAVSTVSTTTTTPKTCTGDSDCTSKFCSNSGQTCITSVDCPTGGTCTTDSCNNRCATATTPCLDSTYSNTGDYPGYFKQTKAAGGDAIYCYSTKSGKTACTYSGSYDEFDGNAVMPVSASCTYGGSDSTTPYVCVKTLVDAGSGKDYVSQFVATGRFLNWLSMSKFDIQKQILTGGKYRTDFGGDIAGESRGCSGRKFIKTLPALPAISFAVRGGTSTIGNTSQATQYGMSFIEIYKGTYNTSACAAAVQDWQSVTSTNLGPLQVDTNNCIGGSGHNDELAAANQTIHDCFWYFNGHGLTNLQPIKNTCEKIYQTKSPGEIIDPSAPDAICSNSLNNPVDGTSTGFLGSCFTNGTWDDACALRENKNFCQGMGGAGAVADPSSESVVPQTVQNVPGFVMELGLGSLEMINDYTRLSPVPANATKGFPLLVYDSWNFSPWPPTGLIQKYSNNIRFGVMTFQNNGSGSECGQSGTCSANSTNYGTACTADATCTGAGAQCIFTIPCTNTCSNAPERQCYDKPDPVANSKDCNIINPITGVVTSGTCDSLTKSDGGKIIAYVGAGFCSVTTTTACKVDSDCPATEYCNPSIGSHDSGLLRTIDDIQATSWTPFGEAFYNAMGYFARTNAYPAIPRDAVPTSRSDANFASLPAPNLAASYLTDKNPSQYRCQANNLLLITDGMSTADLGTKTDPALTNSTSEMLAHLYAAQVPYTIGGLTYNPITAGYDSAKNHGYDTVNSCPSYSGSRSINALAWIANNRNIKSLSTSAASTTAVLSPSEAVTTYVVYSGPDTDPSKVGLCDPKTLMTSTALNGGTNLLAAADPTALNTQIDSAFSTVAARAASGTAASILSNSEGSGANIIQAVFFPKKIFENSTYVNWIGEMQNLWYFVDPYINNSTIREDTNSDLKLNLTEDNVVRFAFDSSQDKTLVQRYADTDGDGIVTDSDKVGGLIDPDYVKSIWRAGLKLWTRNDTVDPRTIYTGAGSVSGNTPTLFAVNGVFNIVPGVWDALQIPSILQVPGITNLQRQALANKLIKYVRGTDQANDAAPCLNADCTYRNRRVTIGVCSDNNQKICKVAADCPDGTCQQYGVCSNSASTRCTAATAASDCPAGAGVTCKVGLEWKLGDIISSTPRVQSTVRLNTFNLPSPGGYSDRSYEDFIGSTQYKSRGTVYVGANDGMLHAFNLGILDVTAKGFQKATLEVPAGTTLGSEKWAYIPMNTLPYLKYFADKDYSHLYSVDGRTVILDASIGNTCGGFYWDCAKPINGAIRMVNTTTNSLDPATNVWRTVVLAGMGLGGAARNSDDACTTGAAGDCVKTPVSGVGYSSYFALDVTYPDTPKFLWEFSNPQLGFSTSAPAIVRIGSRDKNGRWFAVFGNGPTGPIDSGTHQFKATSNQSLKFFVVDLNATPPFALNTNYWILSTLADGTTIDNAFAGTMLGGAIDTDRRYPGRAGNYQDDAVYAGYVKKSGATWTDGGVVRIMTKEDPNPANWVVSKVIDGIGPVTTAIARTQDTRELKKILWLFFGTGRYFYRDAATLDDNDTRRALFGIQEPCFNSADVPGNVLDPNCTATLSAASLLDQTSSFTDLGASDKGWRIDLDAVTATEGAERVVTDTVALTNGTVFFTSFKPTMDICGYGGNSFLWGVKYDTGGQAAANALTGKALIQLSTGEFKEVDLADAFTDKLNRRMATPMTGKPPSDAPPIISSSQNRPVKKILHIQEH